MFTSVYHRVYQRIPPDITPVLCEVPEESTILQQPRVSCLALSSMVPGPRNGPELGPELGLAAVGELGALPGGHLDDAIFTWDGKMLK